MSDIAVRIDDRLRLLGALLAASRYPALAQARKKHSVHAHARATRARVAALADHPAVRQIDAQLAADSALDDLFALAFSRDPLAADDWRDFAQQADLPGWWRAEADVWERSAAEAERALAGAALIPFLSRIFGPLNVPLIFLPNIGYPGDREIGLAADGALMAIVPPRPAWGDSPPWPFDEDPAQMLRAALLAYSQQLLRAALADQPETAQALLAEPLPAGSAGQFAQIFSAGLVALYFEDHVSPHEAKAYLLMEQRLHGLNLLPAAVRVLRAYQQEPQAGSAGALAELLRTFAARLHATASP